MSNSKEYKIPFYILLLIVLIYIGFKMLDVINLWHMSERPSNGYSLRYAFVNRVVQGAIVSGVLLVECIVYWLIRKKNIRKDFAWGHLIGVFVGIVFIPLVISIYLNSVDLSMPTKKNADIINVSVSLNDGLFYALLFLTHLCFLMVLVNVFRERKEKPADEEFLQDYVE